MPTKPKSSQTAQDLPALFADTDAQTKLEALRIATSPKRIWAWAGVIGAVSTALLVSIVRFKLGF